MSNRGYRRIAIKGALPLVLGLSLLLGACDSRAEDDATRRSNDIDQQIAKNGYALVGKTPDGKPLYMEEINLGWIHDRVYFTQGSISAIENCGKNCVKTVTSKQ